MSSERANTDTGPAPKQGCRWALKVATTAVQPDGQRDTAQVELIHRRFEQQACLYPEATAVIFGDESLSYAELNCRANQLAHRLIGLGVSPDQTVAICVDRGLAMIVGLLAILKAGGAYVPLDPNYPVERLTYVLGDSGARVMVRQRGLQYVAATGTMAVVEMDAAGQIETPAAVAPGNPTIRELQAQHLAYVIYTSGSTGQPKGVMVEHRQVVRLFTSTQAWFRFDENDVWSLFHSFAFDFSVWEIWGALLYGGTLVVVSARDARSPEDFYALLCRKQVTVLNQTPGAFRQLLSAQAVSAQAHSLRTIIFGGEALVLKSLKPWFERNNPQATTLVNMYGITETTVHATYRPIYPADCEGLTGSVVGTPLPDLKIYILDNHRAPVPAGVEGEIYVGGAGLARGYLNRPALTAERFTADPFETAPEARMYKSGDLGRWLADGGIEYLGRNDFQVKVRGFRIELGEIESVLLENPFVKDAVLIATELAEGERQLIACLVPREKAFSLVQLRRFCNKRLPAYMVPSRFLWIQSVPLTANGKVDRSALAQLDLHSLALEGRQPAAAEAAPTSAHAFDAEKRREIIYDIWRELLNIAHLSPTDDFVSLGGNSLAAVRLMLRVRKAMNQKALPLQMIFERPCAGEFADAVLAFREDAVTPMGSPQIRGTATSATAASTQEAAPAVAGLTDASSHAR